MRYLMLLLALTLTGCAIAKQVPLPDGSTGYAINACREPAACYRKAAKVCGGKYEILSESSGTHGGIVGGLGAVSSHYQMTVRCPQ